MDGKWSQNSFQLGFSCLVNHSGVSSVAFLTTYLLATHKQIVSR
jgi:hypothetical protein